MKEVEKIRLTQGGGDVGTNTWASSVKHGIETQARIGTPDCKPTEDIWRLARFFVAYLSEPTIPAQVHEPRADYVINATDEFEGVVEIPRNRIQLSKAGIFREKESGWRG